MLTLEQIIAHSCRERIELTRRDLFDVLSDDIGILESIHFLNTTFESFGLDVSPPLDVGTDDDLRVVKTRVENSLNEDFIRGEIQDSEGGNLEFKSTLLFDIGYSLGQPGKNIKEYKTEAVIHSSMKTICAFLNSNGGTLYLGVDDENNVRGLAEDCKILDKAEDDMDSWELCLRDLLASRFYEGARINDLISCQTVCLDGMWVARISVPKSRNLAFCRKKNGAEFLGYRRQGNRTWPLPIEEVESYLRSREL